jgi:hypothetical protein
MQLDIVWNGKVISTVTPSDTAYHQYHFNVVGTGRGTLSFRAVAGDTDDTGALLDNVKLVGQAVTTPPAAGHVSLLTNGSFATTPALANGASWTPMAKDSVTGWTSTNTIEVRHDGFNGQAGTNGGNVVEVDAGNGTLSQTVTTPPGEIHELSFDVAGRAGYIASSRMEVAWNGQMVSTVTPTDTALHNYKLDVVATGHDTLAFRSVAGDSDRVGALLDNVLLHGHAIA